MQGKRALLTEKSARPDGVRSEEISFLFSEHLESQPPVFRQSIVRRIRKQLPAHVDESLQLLLETTDRAVFWKDLKHRYLGCNSRFLQLLELPNAEKILGKTDRDVRWQSAPNTQRIRRHEYRCILQDKALRFALEFRIPGDADSRVLRITLAPLHSRQRKVIGLFGCVEDRSREQRMEKALRSCNGRFRSILEQLPGTLCLFDQDLNVSLCSGAAAFSSPAQEHQRNRLSLYELFQTDDPDSPPISAARRALLGKSVRFFMSKNGRRYQVQVEPLRDGANITGGICLTVEVSGS